MDETNQTQNWVPMQPVSTIGVATTNFAYGTGDTNIITIQGILSSVDSGAKNKVRPEIVFKYMKKKFGTFERMSMDRRLSRLEKAFNAAVDNGQEYLGNKIWVELVREARESAMFAKGIKYFIENEHVMKHKRSIEGGHISNTPFQDFTRVIPDEVLEKKKKTEGLFDRYEIWHYWDEKAEQKRMKNQKACMMMTWKTRSSVMIKSLPRRSNL